MSGKNSKKMNIQVQKKKYFNTLRYKNKIIKDIMINKNLEMMFKKCLIILSNKKLILKYKK